MLSLTIGASAVSPLDYAARCIIAHDLNNNLFIAIRIFSGQLIFTSVISGSNVFFCTVDNYFCQSAECFNAHSTGVIDYQIIRQIAFSKFFCHTYRFFSGLAIDSAGIRMSVSFKK